MTVAIEIAGLTALTIAGFLVAGALGFAVLGLGLLWIARGLA